jgi:hypothetical protein
LQDSKRFGVRFEPVNPSGWKLFVKEQDGSADVAPDIQDGFRLQVRWEIILRFATLPEQHLINGERIRRGWPIKNVAAAPGQFRQRLAADTGERQSAGAHDIE